METYHHPGAPQPWYTYYNKHVLFVQLIVEFRICIIYCQFIQKDVFVYNMLQLVQMWKLINYLLYAPYPMFAVWHFRALTMI